MKGKVQSVEVSYFTQATEDGERVNKTVASFFGINSSPEETPMEGHFGNSIVGVRYHVTGTEASDVFERLVSSLSSVVREEVKRDIPRLVDEHSALYLRLDKQEILGGRAVLSGTGAVRVKVKPRLVNLRQGAQAFYLGALGG